MAGGDVPKPAFLLYVRRSCFISYRLTMPERLVPFCELPPVPGHLMGVPEEECVVVFVSPVFFGRWVVALSACELEPDGSQGSAEVCVGVR